MYKWYPVKKSGAMYLKAWQGPYLHRLIVQAKKGQIVDHINHDGLDNRRSNLRLATAAQNTYNQKKHTRSSHYKGVYKVKNRQKWRCQVFKDNKRVFVGYYDTEEEAARAYDEKAVEIYGSFASVNFS